MFGNRNTRGAADDDGYTRVDVAPMTAADAVFPRAVSALQRMPEPILRYDKRIAFGDWWAGRVDRTLVRESAGVDSRPADPPPRTHRLQTLQHCFLHQVERERLSTVAMIASIDDRLSSLYRELEIRATEIVRAQDRVAQLGGETPTASPRSTAENFESDAERMARRLREHDRTLAVADGQLASHRSAEGDVHREIAVLHTDRTAHWSALLVRVQHSCEFYNRRANTYLRAAFARSVAATRSVETSSITPPSWANAQSIPAAPRRE